MIPWMREKIAERRAKWLAARNKRSTTDKDNDGDDGTNAATTATAAATSTLSTVTNSARNRNNTATQLRQRNGSVREPLQIHEPTNRINGCATTNATTRSSPQRTTSQQRQDLQGFATPQPTRISKLKHSRRSSASSSTSCPNPTLDSRFNFEEGISSTDYTKEHIKVRVVCPSSRLLVFQADANKSLIEFKNEIILELSDDPMSLPLFATDVRQLLPRYRLIRAEYDGAELNDTLTLSQLHITNNDTLVLVPRRYQLQQLSIQTREMQALREQDIETATENVPEHHVDMPMVDINEIFQQSNLQFDVRKVLISLAQASAAVIGAGPYASRLILMLKQKLINKRTYQSETLQCLVDMGFKKEKAEYALKSQNGVYSAALEWLLLHQSDDMLMEEAAMTMQKSQSVISPTGILTNDSILENTAALLEIVRIYSHRDIPPSPDTVNALIEMGFEEHDVLDALKKTCNNKAAACEWLCGNRTGSLIELRDGLAQDSPILKSILELPQVQMNLSNPKILLAFLSILENENSIRVWGGDNDTTSVITHILQKYHEEKHVLGINQFYSNR